MTAVNRERGCHNGRRPPFLSARPEPEPHEPAAGIWVAHRATISQPSADWVLQVGDMPTQWFDCHPEDFGIEVPDA